MKPQQCRAEAYLLGRQPRRLSACQLETFASHRPAVVAQTNLGGAVPKALANLARGSMRPGAPGVANAVRLFHTLSTELAQIRRSQFLLPSTAALASLVSRRNNFGKARMATADCDILATLYDGVLDDARLQKSLASLAERFHSPSSALLSLDLAMPTANAFAASGIFGHSKALNEYHADFAPLDPAPAAFARSPAMAATTTDRMIAEGRIDPQSRATRTFVNEYFGPLGNASVQIFHRAMATRLSLVSIGGANAGPMTPKTCATSTITYRICRAPWNCAAPLPTFRSNLVC